MLIKEFISIIIPYHRKKKFFQETISSLAKQTYQNFEIILIYDDNNKSELSYIKKIINQYKLKTKIINNTKNIGAGLSRNKGLKLSKGDFVAFCDADDLWDKNKLLYQLKFIKKNKLLFSHSSYDVINYKSKKIGSFNVPKVIYERDLIKSCDIGLSSVMISKKLLKNFSFSSLKTKEDYLLWLQIIQTITKFSGIKKKLVSWRNLENSLSSSQFQRIWPRSSYLPRSYCL